VSEVSVMATTLTTKGQVTIPKKIRDVLHIGPGSAVEFEINKAGEIVLRKAHARATKLSPAKPDRFDKVRGTAQIKWHTDELMGLLRG
jgi:antitoxin PrlF